MVMKKTWVILSAVLMALILIIGTTYKEVNKEYLRIHIRANSNLEVDQLIKYEIKDAIVETLIPYVANCNSFEDVEFMLEENLQLIDNVANAVLKKRGLFIRQNLSLQVKSFQQGVTMVLY